MVPASGQPHERGKPVAGSCLRVAVFALVLVEVVACAIGSTSGFGFDSPPIPLAVGGDHGGYPHLIGQEHIGRQCRYDETVIAGGTIVGVGGQVVAAGGGTGIGCDIFYAYELRSGEPSSRQPFVEPGYTLRPGAPAGGFTLAAGRA
jgi:hypothetical protein